MFYKPLQMCCAESGWCKKSAENVAWAVFFFFWQLLVANAKWTWKRTRTKPGWDVLVSWAEGGWVGLDNVFHVMHAHSKWVQYRGWNDLKCDLWCQHMCFPWRPTCCDLCGWKCSGINLVRMFITDWKDFFFPLEVVKILPHTGLMTYQSLTSMPRPPLS